MCDLGITLGIAAGVAQAAGQMQVANQEAASIHQRANAAYAADEGNYLVKAQAANKDAYQATLEGDRMKSAVIAKGEGAFGSTPALQLAEQDRQTALSIANAKDQREGALVSYIRGTKDTQNAAATAKAQAAVNPLATFTNIATSGLRNYGAFK